MAEPLDPADLIKAFNDAFAAARAAHAARDALVVIVPPGTPVRVVENKHVSRPLIMPERLLNEPLVQRSPWTTPIDPGANQSITLDQLRDFMKAPPRDPVLVVHPNDAHLFAHDSHHIVRRTNLPAGEEQEQDSDQAQTTHE